ncbi:hypothetical protein ANCCAN_24276 [Ancylostoma caninum]|uniref:Uncharacterized protein n=1 Tax=Ancylostoma caninum TaxID=29170 RepID=A0A368FEG7_ANCCA|nr:hypothetical protein ANCCAN_24276 [Ancylostoma caninum]
MLDFERASINAVKMVNRSSIMHGIGLTSKTVFPDSIVQGCALDLARLEKKKARQDELNNIAQKRP